VGLVRQIGPLNFFQTRTEQTRVRCACVKKMDKVFKNKKKEDFFFLLFEFSAIGLPQ
jgi:hypothetical protein